MITAEGTPILSTTLWALITVLSTIAWIAAHRWLRRRLAGCGRTAPVMLQTGAFLLWIAVGTLALTSFWQVVSRFVVLETTWPPIVSGLVGAAALEIAVALYQWERRILEPRIGRTLLALRIAAIAVVLLILAQPVLAWLQYRQIERRVVVLIDDSESMQLVDRQMNATEKFALARFYNLPIAEKRAPLHELLPAMRSFQMLLGQEIEKWRLTDPPVDDEAKRPPGQQQTTLNRLIEEGVILSQSAAQSFAGVRREESRFDESTRRLLNEVHTRLCDQLPGELREAELALTGGNRAAVHDHIKRAAGFLDQGTNALPGVIYSIDTAILNALTETERKSLDEAVMVPRAKIAYDLLAGSRDGGQSLVDRLKAQYDLTFLRFGKTSDEIEGPGFGPQPTMPGFRMRTDVTGALEQTLQKVAPESLAGILLLTDGRHNGDKPVDDAARALATQGSTLRAVPLGSEKGPKDAAFLKVNTPEAIYLGDRIRIQADLKADGMKGVQLKVLLAQGDTTLDTETVPIPEERHRTTVSLFTTPDTIGVLPFTLKIEPVEGELFTNNNTWTFETAITDDRTHVLLVDSYPRWEFRYLRNLFYARDKSVHLQYVLLNPDRIRGQEQLPALAASATRRFGEAEATRLPESAEEWLKFDVIILGDVAPATFPIENWEVVERCVSERGALLVIIAGPRAMPHAYSSAIVTRLLPVEYSAGRTPLFRVDEAPYAFRLTSEGKNSPIMQQSPGGTESADIWAALPALMWRYPVRGVKPGAEVLAFAEEAGRRPADAATAEERLSAFAKQRQIEAANALLVTSRYGLGKVAMLNFDQTWRLRYGVGDVYHHRFWGNLLRWGTGENLRAGTEKVRLGTDKLSYEPGQPVKVLAKLTADGYQPHTAAEVTAHIFSDDEQQVAKRRLEYRAGSSGIYEADIPAETMSKGGRYRVVLSGNDVDQLLRGGALPKVETHFTQLPTTTPVELGDLSVDRDFLKKTASLTNGSVVEINDAASLENSFGAGSKTVEERRETTLWDNWILFVTAVGLLTSEWIIRRHAGVA